MMDDKDRKIQELENAIKIQANAFKILEAAENRELNRLRRQEVVARQVLGQLDSEREMNAILTGEVEGLRSRLGAEAAEERAKIVAWLRDRNKMSDVYIYHVEARELAQYIETGEHLK